jgi:c-di-GMP-related signal transduction protein
VRFIARQPIFDLKHRVYGYELLFREGWENCAVIEDFDHAGRMTLDNSFLWGLDQLSKGTRVFVNCTREMLTKRLIEVLPASQTVVEVLETVSGDREVIEACRGLREKGYVIALDDVSSFDEVKPYLSVVKIVKVDLRLTDLRQRRDLVQRLRRYGMTALAEKVETRQEHREAVQCGFQLFQGYFFQKPEVMQRRDVPALQTHSLRLLQAASAEELDFQLIEDAIRQEPSLCFRLLRYLNSPLFAIEFEIRSIEHALQLLGESEVRRWLMVTVAAALGEQKSPELVVWALVRARFCELAASDGRVRVEGAFLMGLLSALPALLEIPMEALLEHLPVSRELKGGLQGEQGRADTVLKLMLAYEKGNWSECGERAAAIGIGEERLARQYLRAVQWANEVAYPPPRAVYADAAAYPAK